MRWTCAHTVIPSPQSGQGAALRVLSSIGAYTAHTKKTPAYWEKRRQYFGGKNSVNQNMS